MMKKKYIKYLFFALSILIFWRCSKPYSEALPTVQVVSIVHYGMADSVLITGSVTSTGASPIEYEGFSFSNAPVFDLLSRQTLLNTTSTTFTTVIPAYHDSTFYFEAFAANQYGYAVSSVYKYTVPVSKPDSAPCTLSSNSLIVSGQSYPFSFVETNTNPPYGFGTYMVSADFEGGNYSYDVYFNQVPTNGIYAVLSQSDFTGNPDKYVVTMDFGGTSNPFNEGGYVYIAQNPSGSTTLSFCSLTFNLGFTNNIPASSKVTFN